MLAAVLEESDARRPDSSGVEVFALGEELEVDKVTCPLAALARHGMEFLRDLVVGAHHGHRLGCLESDIGEQVHEVGGQVVLRLVGIADLVVAEFEFHRAPRSAPVVELDVEWKHLTDHDERHRDPATKGEAVAAFKVPDSLF